LSFIPPSEEKTMLRLIVENKWKDASYRGDGRNAPTSAQMKWLARGLTQAGGKLPLFDEDGQRISERTVLSCLEKGWAKPWFDNPIKPDWRICALTETGRQAVLEAWPKDTPPSPV